MNEQEKAVVRARKIQEGRANLTNSGILAEMAKWHKTLYDAYIKEGFTRKEALELVKGSLPGG